jgi:hypothetical protein
VAGSGKKWLIGCGIGCGIMILIVVVVAVSCGLYLKRSFRGIQEAEDSYEEIVELFGEIEAYTPPADGAVPPERMELFLAVRDSLREGQAALEAIFADFPPDVFLQEKKEWRKVLHIVREMGDLINPVGEHISCRLGILIDREMSLGEYLYIYSLAYYSWLGHSPRDGPMITKKTAEDRGQRIFGDEDSTFGPRKLMRRYRKFTLAMSQNQLASLQEAGGPDIGDDWGRVLTAEIGRFETHPDRVLWQGGLPVAIEMSLRPYQDRLEATYSATTNCFELPPDESGRWHNFKFEADIGD